MEENAQELEIPAVALTPDIQPYMFEPAATQENHNNSETEDSSSGSEDGGQMEENQRMRDTEYIVSSFFLTLSQLLSVGITCVVFFY